MRKVFTILKRELAGYFATPVAYVFIVIFLLLSGFFTFQLGDFYNDGNGQATLSGFFNWHPWLYLFLIPALSMRLWAEERKQGTIELLMTLPITLPQAVLGKFLAAWLFAGVALALTFPMWITVNYLGDPDNGTIAAGFLGSLLMSGGFLAIGSCVSALTKNQVIAFVLSVSICLVFLMTGFTPVIGIFSGWLPAAVIEAIASFSFLTHFDGLAKGLIEARDLVFFASLIGLALYANTLLLELKKAD
ncbi:MAG: ABC transporter permease subunit [Planctomycetes bacterium]|nr:ABC transporter permease subunit [Planctomycetota bacterium]